MREGVTATLNRHGKDTGNRTVMQKQLNKDNPVMNTLFQPKTGSVR